MSPENPLELMSPLDTLLERKYCNADLIIIGFRVKLVKQRQKHIEPCCHFGFTRLDVDRASMVDTFEITHHGHHRQSGFNQHPFIAGAFWAELEIFGSPLLFPKAEICQHDCFADKRPGEVMECLVRGMGTVPVPSDNWSLLIEQPAELDSNLQMPQRPSVPIILKPIAPEVVVKVSYHQNPVPFNTYNSAVYRVVFWRHT